MNAETEQVRPTLNLVGRWDFDAKDRARDMLLKAGLSMLDAGRMVKAERLAATLCALVTLVQRDSRLRDTEDAEQAKASAALDGYLRGGVEDALDLLAMDLYGLISEVGTGDKS